ncbi:MAG: radical SAM protein [Candidatus Hydrothermarchaeota archaeon]|nr:radical SAM protein [Candidatus Hydrothermarchaeota archaeon]
MYGLIRPDALLAFEDEGVKKALGRYVEVSTNRKPAKFLMAKAIPTSAELAASEEELWKEHDSRIKEFVDAEKELCANTSLLDLKLELARRILSSCHFCERRCGADRTAGKKGFCNLDAGTYLSSEFLHLGEEACLVPSHTFFFIGCTFYCVYCQNWTISRHVEKGVGVTGKHLAEIAKRRRMLENSRNINFVGGEPTPNLHTIIDMLRCLDVSVPVVWNSNMYMSSETIELLNGIVDVYLADFKYGNDACAERLSKVENYWKIITRNHLLGKEHAELLIRHLILPNHVECCTKSVLEWIAENLGNEVRVNIMAQYRPEFEAYKIPEIARGVTGFEMERALAIARENGLTNLD